MSTGEIEVVASEVKVLNASKEKLPIQIHDFQQVNQKQFERVIFPNKVTNEQEQQSVDNIQILTALRES